MLHLPYLPEYVSFFITHHLKNVSAYNSAQKLNIFCIGILLKIVDCDGASSYLIRGVLISS